MDFIAKGQRHRFCREQCRPRKIAPPKIAVTEPARCEKCGKTFDKKLGVRAFCGERCRRLWYKRLARLSPKGRLEKRLRKRLNRLVSDGRAVKKATVSELIGCKSDFLVRWIEQAFQPGMGWHNYGQWHIDHITPCKSFDLHSKAEQKRCFHYTNLRPLWGVENIKKGDKTVTQHLFPSLLPDSRGRVTAPESFIRRLGGEGDAPRGINNAVA